MKQEYFTKSTDRVISVLKQFTSDEPELSLAEISNKSQIAMTTTYRILTGLVNGRLLDRDQKTGRFRIGPELYIMGSLYLRTTDIIKAAQEVIEALNDITEEAINVGILDGTNITLVMKEEAKHPFRIHSYVGTSYSAHVSAAGKALLSELTGEELKRLYPNEALLAYTNNTIATRTKLITELKKIRKTGVSYDNGERLEPARGIGAPIHDASNRAIAALSITFPNYNMGRYKFTRLARTVMLASSLISYRLGCKDNRHPIRSIEEIRNWWVQK